MEARRDTAFSLREMEARRDTAFSLREVEARRDTAFSLREMENPGDTALCPGDREGFDSEEPRLAERDGYGEEPRLAERDGYGEEPRLAERDGYGGCIPVRRAVCAAFLGWLLAASPARAGDWPQWRYDAGRTAATPEKLPDALYLQWVRRLPPQEPAWRDEAILQYDAGYMPVVLDGRMFVGSTRTDRVTAYDLASGRELWRFYTGGPVRVAPAGFDGKLYVASDDGHLYCLGAADGRLRWRFRGGPSDRRLVGNERVIATWPCRGGPVVDDGKVYVAAGLWPFMGTFIYALDAGSGRVVWHCDETSFTFRRMPHPGSVAFSGLSPQGHLAVASGKLIVPGGHSTPAVLDCETGEFLFYAEGVGPTIVAGNVEKTASLRKTPWLRAGERLVVGRDGELKLLDVSKGGAEPEAVWQTEIPGTPCSMLAADGRLVVVTLEGAVYCYGPDETQPTEYPIEAPKKPGPNRGAGPAKDVLRAARAGEGYCLVWGLKDGGLVESLVQESELHVVAVGDDARLIDALRRRLDAAGWYGSRAAAIAADPMEIEFAPYLASLIAIEDPKAAGIDRGPAFIEKLFAPLRPYGGTACLPLSTAEHDRFAEQVAERNLPGAEVRRVGNLTLLVRPGPLPGSAPWLGQNADAGNTRVCPDELVKAPLGVLWFGNALSNSFILPRHGEGPVEQVAGGRLFIEGPDSLSATDVYTGRLLWTREFPGIGRYYNSTKHQPGAHTIGSNFFAVEDAVYVSAGKSCHVLDPASGRTRRELKLPGGSDWQFLLVYEDLLIAGADPVIDHEQSPRRIYSPTSSRRIVVMDRQSGKEHWSRRAEKAFRHYGICAGRGKVFCLDRASMEEFLKAERRGQTPRETPRILALDARTGEVVWQTEQHMAEQLSYSEEHDVLVSNAAFRGEDGSLLWHDPDKEEYLWFGKWGMMLNGRRLFPQVRREFDLLTGQQRTYRDAAGREREWQYERSYGCGPMAGGRHLITFRSGTAAFFDLAHDGGTASLGGFRSGCTSNLIPAEGVLNAPDYSRTCSCEYQNRSSLALVHMPGLEYWTYGAVLTPGRIGLNLGAPGDRRADDGTLWIAVPNLPDREHASGPLPQTEPDVPETFYVHSLRLPEGEGHRWVAGSGMTGLRRAAVPLAGIDTERPLRVRLYFSEPEHDRAGARVFGVSIDGRRVIEDLDVFRESGGRRRTLVKEFPDVVCSGRTAGGFPALELGFRARTGEPVLCGVEVVEQPAETGVSE